MSVTMKLKELKPLLELASKFVADRDIVPALQFLYFKGNQIRAYSGTAGATVDTPWAFGPEGFAVPAAPMLKMISSWNDQGREEVTYSLKDHGQPMILKCGKSTSKLPTLPKDQMADFVLRDPPTTKRTLVALEFWSDVERVLGAVGLDETKPALRGVYWSPQGHLVTSDSKRVSLVSPHPKRLFAPPDPAGVTIPEYLLAKLGSNRLRVTEIMVDNGVMWFFLDRAAVWGSMLSADFPGERCMSIIKELRDQVYVKKTGTWVGLGDAGRGELRAALDRLLFFADSFNNEINGSIAEGALELRSSLVSSGVGKDNGSGEESLVLTTLGPAGDFSINGKLLQDAMQQPTLTRFWYSSGKPLYFTSHGAEGQNPETKKPYGPRFEHIVLLLLTTTTQPTPGTTAVAPAETAEDDAY